MVKTPTNLLSCQGVKFHSALVQPPARAVVVGGGPAGIAALGNLLDNTCDENVIWIDPWFNGGRINHKYREVPSNTKVRYFLDYALAVNAFRKIIAAAPRPNAITRLQDLSQDATCSLHHAGDMLQLLSDGLVKHSRVVPLHGNVRETEWINEMSTWCLNVEDNITQSITLCTAPTVVFCTGSSPRLITLPTSCSKKPVDLDLDIALKPSDLVSRMPRDKQIVVGVIGASHSAILVLLNLLEMFRDTHPNLRVKWFTRSSKLKYAKYMDGWILYDNTGLKGQAAEFAQQQIEGDNIHNSDAGKVITRIDCSGGQQLGRDIMLQALPSCDYVVQAVGYTRDELPTMKYEVEFDHTSGRILDKRSGDVIRGLYGAGIAFPERVVDPAGNIEYAVGLFKFMKFLKRVVPEWIAVA